MVTKKKKKKTKKEKLATARNWRLKKTYGIDLVQWNKIFQEQGGCCFICGRHLKIGGKNTRFSANTDHCHETGRIRGILCRRCNTDIVPFFEKNVVQAANLYTYLTRETNYGIVPIR